MLRLSVSELTTFRWSFENDVMNYAEVGVSQIGVWRQKLSDYGEEAGIELMREFGLTASSLTWAGGFTGSDGRSHEEAIQDSLGAIELAARMKAESLVVYTGGRGGHTRSHARRLVVSALKELAWHAEDYGVKLAIEPMHPGCGMDWTFLTSIDSVLELIASVNSESLKFVLDTYHLGFDPTLQYRLKELVPHIGLVQLGDARKAPHGEQDRCLLGQGCIPVEDIVTGLHEHGYEGPYELELIGQEMEDIDNWDVLFESRRALVDLAVAGIGL